MKQSATWTSRESNPVNRITLDRRPEALRCSAGKSVARGLAHVVDMLDDAARAGGNRTRVSTSSPRTLRPSSGIGSRAATPRSATLLSYGTRWRAALPMRAKKNASEESARIELAT